MGSTTGTVVASAVKGSARVKVASLRQPGVRGGRHPGATLIHEESIGVQARRNPRGVEAIDHRFQAGPAARVGFRVGPAITKSKGFAAVKVDLVQPQLLGQLDPVVNGFLGKIPEIEKVGAAVDGGIQRPGTAP